MSEQNFDPNLGGGNPSPQPEPIREFTDAFDKMFDKMKASGFVPQSFQQPVSDPKKEKEFEDMKKELEDAKNKLQEYEKIELEKSAEELVDIEVEKGITNEENKEQAIEAYKNFSKKDLKTLIDKASKVDSDGVKRKSFKAGEPVAGKKEGKNFSEKEKKIKELEVKVKDFRDCGLHASAEEAVKELDALKESE